jgi:hypothetical protein
MYAVKERREDLMKAKKHLENFESDTELVPGKFLSEYAKTTVKPDPI